MEAELWEGGALAVASESWEARACGPGRAEVGKWRPGPPRACGPGRAEVGKWRPGPQALADPVGASGSKAGCAQHWPLAVKQRVKALKNLQA